MWIPKLYNGRNKTFFFFNLERFGNNQLSSSSYSTVPTAAYRIGDFSAALTGKTLTDPTTGLTFPRERHLRSTTTHDRERPRGAHACSRTTPSRKTVMDPVALKIQALIPDPDQQRRPR